MNTKKPHETQIRVRYKDTDQMGWVYYGNYLTYFEVARSEFMRNLGMPYSQMEKAGYFFAISEAKLDYKSNVEYDRMVTVKTRVTEVRAARMRFDYEAVDEDGNTLVIGYTVLACVDENRKVVRIPAEFKNILEEAEKK